MTRIPTHGPPAHPGEMILEEFLKPRAMTRANQLVNGKRAVTTDTALRLEQLFGMPAEFWLTLQLRWDLYHAMRTPAVKAIRKIRRAPGLPPLARSA